MDKRRVFFVLLILLALTLQPQAAASAEASYSVDIPLEVLHNDQPISLQGLISSQTLNLQLPESWLLEGESWIELTIGVSDLLDQERSSLTISINDHQVRSLNISALGDPELVIPIPADVFSSGNNTITFTGMLYLPLDLTSNCQNWDDPSRWLRITQGNLHLSYSRRSYPVDLSNFTRSFLEPLAEYAGPEDPHSTLVVLPAESKQDDVAALVALAYVLGQESGNGSNWNPEVITEAQYDIALAANRNLIFINNTPKAFETVADAGKDFLGIVPSPWGSGNVVLIVGDHDREDGFTAATAFSDPARRLLLHGTVAYLDPALPARPASFKQSTTFKDLGYLDRTVRGIGRQDIIYRLYIPYDVNPSSSTLFLSLAHSPDLDVRNSSFLVYMNGFSVAGILPGATNGAVTTPIKIEFPAARFRPGPNFIRIAFDLHVPYSSCERAPESVWATVFNSSRFDISYQKRAPLPSLNYFPLPFSDDPGFTYVLPDGYTSKDLSQLSELTFSIGQMALRTTPAPEVIDAVKFDPAQAERSNLIMVGLPAQNSAIMKVNDLLPQPFTQDGSRIQEGYGVFLPTSDKDASLGLIQVIASPWRSNAVVLVLTANDPQGMEWTWEKVKDLAQWDQFDGNIMVIGSDMRSEAAGTSTGDVTTISQQTADMSGIPLIGPLLQKTGRLAPLPTLIAAGAATIIVLAGMAGFQILRNRAGKSTGASGEDEGGRDE